MPQDYDCYIHFPEIKGESTEVSHLHWIEVLSYYFGSAGGGVMPGTPGWVGHRAGEKNTFVIVKKPDAATPRLTSAATNGDRFPLVEFVVVKKLGPVRTRTVLEDRFEDVVVRNVMTGGGASSGLIPLEEVTLH